MRKKLIHFFNVCFCISLILLTISACNYGATQYYTESNDGDSIANIEHTCYCIDDFSNIIIGESTIIDVYEIAPNVLLTSTAYGGIAEYPTIDGCIRIEYYGNEHIVRNIEEIKGTRERDKGTVLREP